MSNTPRTDVVESEFVGYYDLAEHVRLEKMTEHARELERELAVEKAAHLEAQKALVVANQEIWLFANARHYNQWQKKFGKLVKAAREAVKKKDKQE